MDTISKEQAEKEVNSWLDYKKISPKKRETLKGNIAYLVEAMMEGLLVLDPETFIFSHTLKFPIGTVKKLEYKPRLTLKEIQDRTQNIKTPGPLEQSIAYISALTGQSSAIIKEMDSEDNSLADYLSFFFYGLDKDDASIDTVITTVVLELKWLPKDLGSLFFDRQDYNGIVYWYDRVLELIKRMSPQK